MSAATNAHQATVTARRLPAYRFRARGLLVNYCSRRACGCRGRCRSLRWMLVLSSSAKSVMDHRLLVLVQSIKGGRTSNQPEGFTHSAATTTAAGRFVVAGAAKFIPTT